MKLLSLTLCLLLQQSQEVTAFSPSTLSLSRGKKYAHSFVVLQQTPDQVRKVGCGIPIKPSGDFSLFNPDIEGKLQGTGELQRRIEKGSSYLPSKKITPVRPENVAIEDAQNWLEDIGVPLNFAKPQAPVEGTILASGRIISDDAPGDIQHVVMQLPPGMHYVEGQSISVIPPGIDSKTSRPHKPRLYSIASTRYGDLLDGNTVSFCIRRAQYVDPVTNQVDPSKAGVCSNFLCDAAPGTKVNIAGPVGKTMLLPEDDKKDIIMIATGTGIAPFRAFLHRLFMEKTVKRHMFQGSAWLVLGVPTTGGLLYHEEFMAMKENAQQSDSLKIDYAISREMKNQNGGKLYVQNVIQENADEFFERLKNGAHVYFCGLKGMMPPILETLEAVAVQRGLDWNAFLKQLKANNQWHVEVY